MAQYGKVEYWDERYTCETEPFEWYQRYSGIRHLLTTEYLAPSQRTVLKKESEVDSVIDSKISSNTSKGEIHEDNPEDDSIKTSTFPPREKCRVLVIGCGNSRLSEEMLTDNWTGGITNIDYSSVVIGQMREKYNDDFYMSLQARLKRERKLQKKADDSNEGSEKESTKKKSGRLGVGVKHMLSTDSNNAEEVERPMIKMIFECVDITKSLPFPDDSFDLIICKGTLDSLLCSPGSIASAASMMEECYRVLDPRHGLLFVVSHGPPDTRLVYFEKNDEGEWWEGGVDVHTVPKPRVGAATVEGKNPSKISDTGNKAQDGEHKLQGEGTINSSPSLHQSNSNEENIGVSVSAVANGVSSLKLNENTPNSNSVRKATIM